jgi:dipeptidase E
VFRPHPSGDFPAHIESFYNTIGPLCVPSHLSLFRAPAEPPPEVLIGQDVIYVGAGSTPNLLAVWRAHGIDLLLRDALDSGTILYGGSAGGLCWFEEGLTDSLGLDGILRPLRNCLGFLAGSHSPHFDSPRRADAFSVMVADGLLSAGIGIDDYAAVHFIDEKIHEVVSTKPDASAYQIARSRDAGSSRSSLPVRRIGQESSILNEPSAARSDSNGRTRASL